MPSGKSQGIQDKTEIFQTETKTFLSRPRLEIFSSRFETSRPNFETFYNVSKTREKLRDFLGNKYWYIRSQSHSIEFRDVWPNLIVFATVVFFRVMDNDVEEVAPQTQRKKIEFKQIPGISPINKFYEIKFINGHPSDFRR